MELIKAVIMGVSLILPLANPLTTVALFLGLSGNMSKERRDNEIKMASIYVFIIMMVSWYSGRIVMETFGISIPGLRIAGGLIVSFIGFRMLFPAPKLASESTNNDSIAFVPLAMPSTAGPGTMAMIISSAATVNQVNDLSKLTILLAPALTFFVVSFILWICLKSSGSLMRFFGKGGIDAISRVMGFILVCMGTQFIINGISEIT